MKKSLKLAYIGAIAFVSISTFSACSSNDDPAIDPVSGERAAVKTEFSIAIPGKSSTSTRMTNEETQANNNFQEIGDVILIPFDRKFEGQARWSSNITLQQQQVYTATNERNFYYSNVSVPIGTKAFLAYVPVKTPINGKLNVTNLNDGDAPSGITFSLQNMESEDATEVLTYLNAPLTVADWATSDDEGLKDLYTRYISLASGSSQNAINTVKGLKAALENYSSTLAKNIIAAIDAADEPASFPTILPEGAIVLKVENGKFVVANEAKDNVGLGVAAQTKYAYPAYIYYKANSLLKTADVSKKSEYTNDVAWSTILSKYDGGDAVTPSTQSVALVDNLQYGVARLETGVKIKDGEIQGSVTIGDNTYTNAIVYKETVTKPDGTTEEVDRALEIGEGFTLTGIVIADQKKVNWNFEPIENEDALYIYDGKVVQGIIAKTENASTVKNSTLVLESSTDVVNVALQFVNNTGSRIVVKNGVIEKGATFYLIGKLDKSKNSSTSTTATKIFQQDYVTKATFGITAQGLYNSATNVIPDLETPELELGLSVDLKWEEGHVYDVNLGE